MNEYCTPLMQTKQQQADAYGLILRQLEAEQNEASKKILHRGVFIYLIVLQGFLETNKNLILLS